MRFAIDAFDRLLAHGTGALAGLAQRGLGWVNQSAELKRVFIARALGLSGELPQAARASAIRSIFAAQMKSFSDSPPIACVV